MTDAAITPPEAVRAEEDKVLPAVVYGLYLLGFTNGLTFVIGLIVAYLNRDTAGPINESHYTFAIRSFWVGIILCLIGAVLISGGAVLMILGIGLPMLITGGAIASLVSVWFVVRTVLGLHHLFRGEAYPRPYTWLI